MRTKEISIILGGIILIVIPSIHVIIKEPLLYLWGGLTFALGIGTVILIKKLKR